MSSYELMRKLTETEGLPGFEDRIYNVMDQEIKNHTNDLVHDHLGSITGKVGNGASKVLLAGHLDEVGFIVSQITEKGFLKIKPLGGWWPHVMLAQRVKVLTDSGDLTGVIGAKPPHLLETDERKKVLDIDDMFIDIGATSREEAKSYGVNVGNPVATICPFEPLPNEKMLLARTWDNRAGCYVALKVLERLKSAQLPNTLYAGATVQEEVGLRGAQTLAETILPDIAFATDVGVATDTPGINKGKAGDIQLGKGPILGFLDRSMIPHRKLRDFVVNTAEQKDIPYQIELMTGGATDGGRLHLAGSGVPTMVVSVPSRYIHSHVSVIHEDDIENAVELLCAVIQSLDEETVNGMKGL
ncbi:M42 family metallopeptidase [Texcoconibacillus texcoconensis]|uniref:Endoglucanase n=1 Tax=Texcoconibacillus texcoconensis TaxID=1095777 RepID=A0A840QSE8_9BACI|nr:M42 family metallopeptidase [Texcoconibacillus texcoconensis]MBB5174270.1 endoglucanase [Texcoconibacillus texcoconensis]